MLWGSAIAAKYILKYRPDAVFATGGFICAPVLTAATLLRVPYVLHDCDAHPGLVSRAFARFAKSVSIAFEGAKPFIRNKNAVFRGNPIREDFFTLTKTQARSELGLQNRVTIVIMGGSQGAKTINMAAVGVIEHFRNNEGVQIILQTGKKNFDEVMTALKDMPENAVVKPYFDNMALPLIAGDIAVSRAGSLSISELCASGLPCVLVPYPFSAANHQKYNADKTEELGAAIVLEDKDCSSEKLLEILNDMLLNPEKLSTMRAHALSCAKPDAVREITEQLLGAV
jgi:UDP-N-acetylglucosamine--N-acetylmuramyl-(pentapeptide) pyrophosphoryl-undecaprenol N-acetylglucosamine transferase